MSAAKGAFLSASSASNGSNASIKLRLRWHSWLHVAIVSSLIALLLLAPGFALIWRAQLDVTESITLASNGNTTGHPTEQSILLSEWAEPLATGGPVRPHSATHKQAGSNTTVREGRSSPPAVVPPQRRRLILVTLTRPRVHQAVHLTNLAHTLCIVPPPVTWIVVEPCHSNTTAALLDRLSRCCTTYYSHAGTSGTRAKCRSIEYIHLPAAPGEGEEAGGWEGMTAAQQVDSALPAVTVSVRRGDEVLPLSSERAAGETTKVVARVLREEGGKGRRHRKNSSKKPSKRGSRGGGSKEDSKSKASIKGAQHTSRRSPRVVTLTSAATVPGGARGRGGSASSKEKEGDESNKGNLKRDRTPQDAGASNRAADACGASEGEQRGMALQWVAAREGEMQGVVYFMEEGNAHTLRLFEELRTITGVGLLPVAFLQDTALHSSGLSSSHINRPRIATSLPTSISHPTQHKVSDEPDTIKPAHSPALLPAGIIAGWDVNGTTIHMSQQPGELQIPSSIEGFAFSSHILRTQKQVTPASSLTSARPPLSTAPAFTETDRQGSDFLQKLLEREGSLQVLGEGKIIMVWRRRYEDRHDTPYPTSWRVEH